MSADFVAHAESPRLANAGSDAERADCWKGWNPDDGVTLRALRVESDGNVWCDATRVLSSSATRDVLDPGGGRLGEVLMPSGFWPSVITNQELFSITRAKLRVEHVATHLLVKPGEVDVDAAVARENALDPPART